MGLNRKMWLKNDMTTDTCLKAQNFIFFELPATFVVRSGESNLKLGICVGHTSQPACRVISAASAGIAECRCQWFLYDNITQSVAARWRRRWRGNVYIVICITWGRVRATKIWITKLTLQ